MIRIYYRVSTDKQDYEAQNNGIQGLLNRMCIDFNLCMIYKDFALSGTKADNRAEYQRLLNDVRSEDTIIVYEFSRLWRDMEEQSKITNKFLRERIQVLSVADGDLRDAKDRLTVGIKGVINEYEAARIKERSMYGIRALQEKCANGDAIWNGRGRDKQKRRTDGYKKRWEKRV